MTKGIPFDTLKTLFETNMRWLAIRITKLSARLLIVCVVLSSTAHAGLGPENVFLVVNRASWASQTVANYYVALRQVPAANIFYLDWTGGTDTIDVETFRQQILGPVLLQIDRRRLSDQIDAIIYSSDFPYHVNLSGDLGKQQPPKQLSPEASITSATFLWQLVMSKNPNVISLRNNQYTRSAGERVTNPLTQGFRSWYGWGANGELIEGGGIRYLLSTMLAVTSGRGNSVEEAVGYLRRAAKADGTRPKGTIYYCVNKDVRSTTRAGGFAEAIDNLTKLGVNAQIVNGILPTGKRDVAGLMTGIAELSWPSAQSTILPGAICENLTSFSGTMAENSSQTPLTEFLRYGAAGASGTVVEPYAMQDKFPLAAIQVHYAHGCALAEAFYQSVFGPYQLLVVGDPLCQPWARIPKVTVEGLKAGDVISGKVNVKASATVEGGKVDRFQMFIDGRRVARRPIGSSLPLDTAEIADGYHELRVVGIDASPIETQGRAIVPVRIENDKHQVDLTVDNPEPRWGDSLVVNVKTPGLAGGVVFANGRVIGQFKGDQGSVKLDPRELGSGPVTMLAHGITADEPPRLPSSSPLEIEIKPNVPLPALAQPKPDQLVQGIRLKTADGKSQPVHETRAPDWLQSAGVTPGKAFGIEGYFDVPPPAKTTVAVSAADVAAQGVRQFQVRYTGDLKLVVDQTVVHDGKAGNGEQIFLPIALAPGLHRLRIAGQAGAEVKLQIRYGGEGTRSIDGKHFRQLSKP